MNRGATDRAHGPAGPPRTAAGPPRTAAGPARGTHGPARSAAGPARSAAGGPGEVAITPAVASAPPAKLAEPPIPGGRVEAMMGVLIRALKASPLARPLPAVTLSALGLAMIAFTGLCATAPGASEATLPVLLPFTALASRLGAPILSADVINVLMYGGMTCCALGLAGMLWANSLGWHPNPRRVFWTAVIVVAVVVCITPVGTSDPASYASYGRIAALGHNPYLYLPINLPGGAHNPYTALVDPRWRTAPSVYGPVATWTQLAAALIGGARPWLTIWALMIMTGIAFLAAGYLMLRTAGDPVRASLIWVANPLLIYVLVMGAQLDVFLALVGIAAILISRRGVTIWHDLTVGVLIGVAAAIKINAGFVALGIAVPLIRAREWGRLLRTAAFAAVATVVLYISTYGVSALKPLPSASNRIISPSIWRLFQMAVNAINPGHPQLTLTLIGVLYLPLMLLLAWYLYNRLSPDVPAVLAATCALTFAWVLVAPWSLPWYTALAWVTLALLPRNSLTRWLTLATFVPAMLHFSGGQPDNHPGAPAP